ncbi:type I-D CRISPR-associated protein Cas10d/Csc3 [Thermoflavimicrobium daqui]|uniref:CRISPR-associated protein Csc3 n=1 Tax=Thermoflavimicrobium daqui TaxID=2137476 RepID=A0A364K783_9BACL|nr:type I-D CRISPR-associated protein Cas10d/Csc3 [Thermoflavimicrobium daqui]RAL26154.1 hypothetical protein DL897_03915 [Thermoflavimicrobium daqui]
MGIYDFAQKLLNNFAELTFKGERLAESLAKYYNYNPTRNLLDQSMWDHIRSGIEAYLSLTQYLERYDLPWDEREMKVALIGYALHDLHKSSLEKKGSEYGLPPADIEVIRDQLCQGLEIDPTEIPAEFIRVAGVSSFSNKMGDFSHLPFTYPWLELYHWIKLMDKAASITSIAECQDGKTLHNLTQLLRYLLPKALTEKMRIEYHYVQDIRGMISSLLHAGMAEVMKEKGYYPWLRFGDGTLYLSFEQEELFKKEDVAKELVQYFFQSINQQADEVNSKDLYDSKSYRCQTLAFMIYSKPEQFAYFFYQLSMEGKAKNFPSTKISEKQLSNYKVKRIEDIYEKLGIDPSFTEDLQEKWFFTSKYFAFFHRLIQRVNNQSQWEAIQVLANYLQLEIEDMYKVVPSRLDGKHMDLPIWLSYRYLKSLSIQGKPVEKVHIEEIREIVREMGIDLLSDLINPEICVEIVDQEMKISQELDNYFGEQLILSWDKQRKLNLIQDKELLKPRKANQGNVCNLCNRHIIGKDKSIREGIIQDIIQVYSNRLLPKEKSVSALHWCGICMFEYLLRQLFGMQRFEKKFLAHRIYLFAIPSFQLTDIALVHLYEELKTIYGAIVVHDRKEQISWQAPLVQQDHRNLRKMIREYFRKYSESFRLEMEERGKPRSNQDLFIAGFPSNVMLFTYDCYKFDEKLERTREEAWMKALTAALSLNKLFGFRIMITEKPFLTLSDIRDIHYAVHLDAPPYKLAKWIQQNIGTNVSELAIPIEHATNILYQLAYMWEVHQNIHPYDVKKPTDKQISEVLHQIETHGIPGSYFFKRQDVEGKYVSETFIRSCVEVNQSMGGKMMGLAQEIALVSLKLYSPDWKQNGRAHRFENLYRTVTKGIREGRDLSQLHGLVLKRLERLHDQSKNNKDLIPYPVNLERVEELINLIYHRFFMEECGGSLAKLSHKENQLADGIYFETYREVQKRIQEKIKSQEDKA